MTIQDLGFGTGGSLGTLEPNLKIYEGRGSEDIRLLWSTERGTDANKEFELTLRYTGWYKGVTVESGWSSTRSQTVFATDCNPAQRYPGSRWYWNFWLAIDGMINELAGGQWSYESRKYDTIHFQLSVTAIHTQEFKEQFGAERSETAYFDGWIGYVPKYRLTGIYYETSDLVVIEYDTTWTRIDDRYCIESLSDRQGPVVIGGEIWGSVAALGRIEIPTSKLLRHIKGQQVALQVRFNATYRMPNAEFYEARGSYICEDRSICNTPYITLVGRPETYDDVIRIRTGDRKDLGAPIEQVTVKLQNGKYSFDEQTVLVGEIAEFRYFPLNTELAFDAVGSRGKATSAVAEIKASPIKSESFLLSSLKTGETIKLDLRGSSDDAGLSISTKADYETLQLARRRPSAFYGTSGQTHISMNRVLVRSLGGIDDLRRVEALPEQGDMVIRDPDGHVYAFAGEVSITSPEKPWWKVSISGDEVDA